jgi:tetratricopeptide (TPR) repeat protein
VAHPGNTYAALGEVQRAIAYCGQQLGITREIGDRSGEGNALANMGLAYEKLENPGRARDLWQQALAIYEAIEDPAAARVREWLEGLPTL